MFTNVLKKFFTLTVGYENKVATEHSRNTAMAEEIKLVLTRSRETIVADALGVVALMVLLIVGLTLPGLI
ncbi:hypothetical protein SAMN05444714_1253 [Yoonia litorea]|uniref:Uncharacterized protein n=1 Tax=Yoonia litorea TaxID=1123755 RepID=A0A1I6M5U3_9RHOB|nr:hypothetical protein SAMN05444714_1253 [Yoonia litorea]